VNINKLQMETEVWADVQFGKDAPSYLSLIKLQEELGELASHYIGRLERREGKISTKDSAGIVDGVADILITLCVFCNREGIDLQESVIETWGRVSKRKYEVSL
jgi:NTP pyrophosphatase (non-canonical NTP hydrolase)